MASQSKSLIDDLKAEAEQEKEERKSAAADLIAQLESSSDVRSWVPENAGDVVAGKVAYIGTVVSDYARPGEDPNVPYIELTDDDGELWGVRAYGSVLKGQIEKTNPAVGDTIAVIYDGVKTSKSGNDYKSYRVRVARASS